MVTTYREGLKFLRINLLKDIYQLLQCPGLERVFSFESFTLLLEGKTKREIKIKHKQENISFFTSMSFVIAEEEVWSDIA